MPVVRKIGQAMSLKKNLREYMERYTGCGRKIGPFGCCTVVCGDALELLRQLPSKSISAVVTDPPYGTQLLNDGYGGSTNGGGYGRKQLHSEDGRQGRVIANDRDLSLMESSMPLIWKRLKTDSWLMTFCGARTMMEMGDIVRSVGMRHYGEVVWNKRMSGLGYGAIRYQHESILIFAKGKPKKNNSIFSVIEETQFRADSRERHPHEKPVRVVLKLLSLVNGPVLDPFCGTGAVPVACKMTGLHFLGFELEPPYVKEAQHRLLECNVRQPRASKKPSSFLYYEL